MGVSCCDQLEFIEDSGFGLGYQDFDKFEIRVLIIFVKIDSDGSWEFKYCSSRRRRMFFTK